jgi:hypothetical protein
MTLTKPGRSILLTFLVLERFADTGEIFAGGIYKQSLSQNPIDPNGGFGAAVDFLTDANEGIAFDAGIAGEELDY